MDQSPEIALITRRYRDRFGARLTPCFSTYMSTGSPDVVGAALGYRRAGEAELFLEVYLDQPIEQVVSDVLGCATPREKIVEIGNFAADNALAMVDLWGSASNDLGDGCEVAVATLTLPLRRMFSRIGIPIYALGPALPGRLHSGESEWGRYYENDPQLCAGRIAEGQEAIARFIAKRRGRAAA